MDFAEADEERRAHESGGVSLGQLGRLTVEKTDVERGRRLGSGSSPTHRNLGYAMTKKGCFDNNE